MPEARVNFAGITAFPRNDEEGNFKFWSCSAPVRGHEKHDRMDVIAKDDDELKLLRDVGVVELKLIDTYTDEYEDSEGETAERLNCTYGSIMARGEW